MISVGISIGAFVGIISGIIVLVIMRPLSTASIGDAKPMKMLIVQLLGVITFVLGASFLVKNHSFTQDQDTLKELTIFYFNSLGITFILVMIYPLSRWVHKLGREFGELKG